MKGAYDEVSVLSGDIVDWRRACDLRQRVLRKFRCIDEELDYSARGKWYPRFGRS
jgi:hypothetical protein